MEPHHLPLVAAAEPEEPHTIKGLINHIFSFRCCRHEIIDIEPLHRKQGFSLKSASLGYQDLVAIVCQSVSRPEDQMSERQRRALAKFRSEKIFDFDSVTVESDNYPAIMLAYATLFDDLFFNNSVMTHTTLNVNPSLDLPIYGSTSIGFSILPGVKLPFFDFQRSPIIHIYPKTIIELNRGLLGKALGVLLHEMLHAFFYLWGCPSCSSEICNIGETHGIAFLELGYKLEQASIDLLRLALQVGKIISLAQELIRNPHKVVNDEQLQTCGLDPASFKSELAYIKSSGNIKSSGSRSMIPIILKAFWSSVVSSIKGTNKL